MAYLKTYLAGRAQFNRRGSLARGARLGFEHVKPNDGQDDFQIGEELLHVGAVRLRQTAAQTGGVRAVIERDTARLVCHFD